MRLIDADKAISDYAHYGISHPYDAYDLEDILTECPTVEVIPKDQYENRLKADMVAMLTEIREKAWYRHSKYEDEKDFEVDKAVEDIVNHIDAKINSLKEVKDEKR